MSVLRRWISLGSLMVAACAPSEGAMLSVSSNRSVFDGAQQRAIITVTASAADGTVGTGIVHLSTPAGAFVEGDSVTLVDGQATATFRCDPTDDSACTGSVSLRAGWRAAESAVTVRLVPSVVVVEPEWRVISTGVDSELTSLIAGPGGQYWAAGTGGAVVRFDGTTWLRVPTPTTAVLHQLWSDGTIVVAVGNGGTLLVWEGVYFRAVPVSTNDDLVSISGLDRSRLIAVTSGGRVVTTDCTTAMVRSVSTTPLRSIGVQADGSAWAINQTAWMRKTDEWEEVAPFVPGRWSSVKIVNGAPAFLGSDMTSAANAFVAIPTGDDWTFSIISTPGPALDLLVSADGSEQIVITSTSVFHRQGAAPWEKLESPTGGSAIAGGSVVDFMMVGAPGVSLHRLH